MNPKSKIAVVLFVIGLGIMSATSVQSQSDVQTKSYTSTWGDYKTVVPDGWVTSSDFEGTHFTDTSFKSPEPYYSLSIRWYNKYVTHRCSDGLLEMYGSEDDYINQMAKTFYSDALIEQVHDLEVGGLKAKRFIARAGQPSVLPAKYGVLVGKDLLNSPGEHAYTVVSTSSGLYVLIYFAPKGGYEKYGKLYDKMVASFELIKYGPDGAVVPGKTAVEVRSDEVLKQLLSQFQSQKDILFGPPVTWTDWSTGDPVTKRDVSSWFNGVPLQAEKKIIELVSTMKPPPAIPDEATRDFVKATTYMKDAKDASDYQYAIDAFEKALFNAPWWGDAYYNLGIAFEAAGRYDDAMESMKLYLLTNPATAAEDKKRIYAIEAKQEKAAKVEAALRTKYGASDGSSGFNFDSLFRYGAVVQDMSFDASGNARTISLKISTRKENGRLVNYLAIFDMTSQSDTFGQKFSADWRGEQTFFLDDRPSPGKESMTLTVTSFGDGDAKISIRPSDNASASIQTTLADLYRERARQAVYAGSTTKIGEKTFYTLGEGGAKGSLVFFPMEIKDKLEHGEVRDLSPMFVAIVNYRGPSGENASYTQSDLGVIDGTHYYLEHEGGSWVSKIGQGPDN